jgi:hypothetical protein
MIKKKFEQKNDEINSDPESISNELTMNNTTLLETNVETEVSEQKKTLNSSDTQSKQTQTSLFLAIEEEALHSPERSIIHSDPDQPTVTFKNDDSFSIYNESEIEKISTTGNDGDDSNKTSEIVPEKIETEIIVATDQKESNVIIENLIPTTEDTYAEKLRKWSEAETEDSGDIEFESIEEFKKHTSNSIENFIRRAYKDKETKIA